MPKPDASNEISSNECISCAIEKILMPLFSQNLLTAWLGERFDNVRPYYVSCLGILAALALLAVVSGFGLYATGTCLLTFAIGMGVPFAVAEIAELDVDGRFVILSVPAIGMGAMVGPGVAGALADSGSFAPVLGVAGAAIVLSMVLMRYSDRFRQL
jgi:MFS family permease